MNLSNHEDFKRAVKFTAKPASRPSLAAVKVEDVPGVGRVMIGTDGWRLILIADTDAPVGTYSATTGEPCDGRDFPDWHRCIGAFLAHDFGAACEYSAKSLRAMGTGERMTFNHVGATADINPRFLRQALTHCRGPVSVRVLDAWSAVVIRHGRETHTIMPMRPER